MVTQITPINLIPGTMIPRVNISQYDTGARVLKFQVYNGDSLFTFTNAMTVALVGTKPDGKGFSYTGTIASNMPTFDVTAQMSAVAGKVRAELVVFESGERVGSGNFVIFVEEGALGDGTDMSDSDYAIINDALEAAFDLDHFYADLQNMVTEAVEDIQVQQGQTVIDPTLTISGAAADAKATGDMARNFLEALMTETTTEASIASIDDGAGGLPLKQFVGNIQPAQAGEGDPSPDNVRAISGYSAVNVVRAGKNVLHNTATSSTINGVTFTVNADGTIKANGTASASITFVAGRRDKLVIGERYILTGCPTGGGTATYRMAIANPYWAYDTGDGYTFVAVYSATIDIRIQVASGAVLNNVVFQPMIRLASITDATYEAPQIATYPVTFPTEAGTVYGGTLNVFSDGSGALTVDRGYFKPDSTSQTGTLNTGTVGNRCGVMIPGLTIPDNTADVLCSCGIGDSRVNGGTQTNWIVGHCALYKGGSATYFRYIFPTTVTTAADALQYLIDHNCEITYTMPTPTTYALSAVQVAQMLQGDNNIWMNAAGTVQATYYANTALYVEKRIAELQALVLENQ